VFKKACVVLLTFLTLFLASRGPALASNPCGVMDASGKWLIPPNYYDIQYLGPNLLSLCTFENHYILARLDGKPISPTPPPDCYTDRILFGKPLSQNSETDCFFVIRSNKSLAGVMDTTGKLIAAPTYDSIYSYGEGYFTAVESKINHTEPVTIDTCTIFLDCSGNQLGRVPTCDYSIYEPFQNGVIVASPCGLTQDWCFFLPDGNKLKLPRLSWALSFTEGFAAVHLADRPNGQNACLIGKNGEILGNRIFSSVQSFSNGLAVVGASAPPSTAIKYGAIDLAGNLVIPLRYKRLWVNDSKTLLADTTDGHVVLLDRRGRRICRYPDNVELRDVTDKKYIPCTLTTKYGAVTKGAVAASLDREGHIYDALHSPLVDPLPTEVADRFGDRWFGLRNRKGWLIPPDHLGISPAGPTAWIVCLQAKQFDSNQWKEGLKQPGKFDRSREFQLFLREYNLIGMSREEVIDLLGDENHAGISNSFMIAGGGCLNSWSGIQIKYEAGKVLAWRDIDASVPDANTETATPWISKNMVYGPREYGLFAKQTLIPKESLSK
jgi:hypothetical protein